MAVVAGGNLNLFGMHLIRQLVGPNKSPASTRSQYMVFEEFVVALHHLGVKEL